MSRIVGRNTDKIMALIKKYCANNYDRLPVSPVKGRGVWIWDADGNKYFDLSGSYSALPFGHCDRDILKAMLEQASRVSMVANGTGYNDMLGPFAKRLCIATGMDKMISMNSGTEATMVAFAVARRWGYYEGISPENSIIILAEGCFHGRNPVAQAGFNDPAYREGFGPFPHGVELIPFGDSEALRDRILSAKKENSRTDVCCFMVERIQGEGGGNFPPKNYLKQCEKICSEHNVLFFLDEVQTGFGRTGKFLACEHDGVKPDGVILAKGLGGGLYPVSAFLAREYVMKVLTPGSYGSTFGGNALASAIGIAAIDKLLANRGRLMKVSAKRGAEFLVLLKEKIKSPLIKDIRGKGLFIFMDIDGFSASAVAIHLLEFGLCVGIAHDRTLRLAPALTIKKKEVLEAVSRLEAGLRSFG